ncbi:DUF4870 domain-containing protein [Zunongwangia sp.]|uniref:DUF4870 domain-containing protein n=1 Tax=Zunongwangia sp. TaxID=1965325 RepID=UPI003AA9759B
METTSIKEDQLTLASITHLSVLSKFFIPLGNFIIPLVIWVINKEKSFIDKHARAALNFQISLLIYYISILFILVAIFIVTAISYSSNYFLITKDYLEFNPFDNPTYFPFIILVFVGLTIFFGLFILELYAVIKAAKHASEGLEYKYPLCINFIR